MSVSTESISQGQSLHPVMNNNQNNSQNNEENVDHSSNESSSLSDSVFLNTQLTMLHSLLAQTKTESQAKAEDNFINQECWSDRYENHSWERQWHLQQNFNSDSSDNLYKDLDFLWDQDHGQNENTHFWSEEIEFFNSHLNVKNYDSEDIIEQSDKIYFCDVHLFIDFFKNITRTKMEDIVCCNLNKCLWDMTQDWYISQLSVIERDYKHESWRVKCWEKLLFHHFKQTQSAIMKFLKTEWYTIQNAQNNQKSSEFVLTIMWHAKNTEMTDISAQLIWVWNCLDLSLWESICCSDNLVIISFFIEEIKNMKEIWFDKYNQCTLKMLVRLQLMQSLRQQDNSNDNCSHYDDQFQGPRPFSYNQTYQNAYNCSYQSYLFCPYNVNINMSLILVLYQQSF